MSCDCCGKKEKALEKLMKLEPKKTTELVAFIDSLPLGNDIDANRGCLIETLHRAQTIFGYLPAEVQQLVSERLKITRSEIYGVISFYSYFTDKPIGRHKINVCCGTACFVKGATRRMASGALVRDLVSNTTKRRFTRAAGGRLFVP